MVGNYLNANSLKEIMNLIKVDKDFKLHVFVQSEMVFQEFLIFFRDYLFNNSTNSIKYSASSNRMIVSDDKGVYVELRKIAGQINNRGIRVKMVIIEDSFSIREVVETILPMITTESIYNKLFITNSRNLINSLNKLDAMETIGGI